MSNHSSFESHNTNKTDNTLVATGDQHALAEVQPAQPSTSLLPEGDDEYPISSSYVAAVSKLGDNYNTLPAAKPSHDVIRKGEPKPVLFIRDGKENIDPRTVTTPKRPLPANRAVLNSVPPRAAQAQVKPRAPPLSTSRLPNNPGPSKRRREDDSPVPAKRHKPDDLVTLIYDKFQYKDKRAAPRAISKGPNIAAAKNDDPEADSDNAESSYCILAHDDDVQRHLDIEDIAFGVQWEIARLRTIGRCDWVDITPERIQQFRGTNALAGPLVAERLWNLRSDPQKAESVAETTLRQWGTSAHPAFAEERSIRAPWAELDKEQQALTAPGHRGLGCSDASNVYHGKVLFVASIHWKEKPEIRLEKPEIGASTRFARRFGSRRFIRMKEAFYKKVKRPSDPVRMKFFQKKFVLLGRVYRAFYEKDGTVHLIETDEDYGRVPQTSQGDQLRMSLWDFVQWHNPMVLNEHQILTKWKSRFALGLSTSVPGVKIKQENVFFIPDIVSTLFDGNGKPPAPYILTDGCGFLNRKGMKMVADCLGWERVPAAVQARFGPAKGLFATHPDNDDDEAMIWLRESQVKINYGPTSGWDPALLILDVVKPPHLSSPAKLSVETIVALSHAGVPHQVFFRYLNDGLSEFIKDLTDWDGENAAMRHWNAISRAGRVIGGRVKRAASGAARAKGLGVEREEENEAVDDDVQDTPDERSTAWWGDQISGCPSSIEESAMAVLNSGFTFRNCEYLRRKGKQTMKTSINAYVSRYRLQVPKSAEAFIIPDPSGRLKRGEIYLHMSQPFIDGRTGEETHVLEGPVVGVRHPCKVPSDVQLFIAVDIPELRRNKDVIICSADDSDRSLASKLAGGDYDGDIVTLFWDPEIINAFQNAPDRFLDPPACVAQFFERSTVQVSEFLQQYPSPSEQSVLSVQGCLLASIGQPIVGLWSVYHDLALYKWGLADERTVILAYMFTTCLDGSKSGLRVKADVQAAFDKIMKQWEPPSWKLTPEELDRMSARNVNPTYDSKFIMERLKDEGKRVGDKHLGKFDEAWNSIPAFEGLDNDLIAPLENMAKFAGTHKTLRSDILKELDAIAQHVQDVRKRHRSAFGGTGPRSDNDEKHGFTSQDITVRQDILRALSRQFAEGPPADKVPISHSLDPSLVERLKASYAYKHDWESDAYAPGPDKRAKPDSRRGTSFPFDVALRTLCDIKARATGRTMTVLQQFYEGFTLHKGYVKMIT